MKNNDKPFKIRLKKGDTVMVRSGKFKGVSGKITAVYPFENKVTVEGVNVVKKHQKPTKKYPQGGIIEVQKPIAVSKVGILDPTSKKPTRVIYKIDDKGNKIRLYAKSKKEV